MRRIVLWRHGRTSWNADRRFQGQTDISLDDVGREQAANAARLLTGLRPTAIISSDLERAADTAAELSTLTGIPVRIDVRLRETYAGDWEGMVWGDIESRYTDEMARWVSDPYLRPGGGETRVEVADRMTAAISEALAELGPDGTLVVTTHGGAARAGLGALLELPPEHWSILGVLTNCAWSVLVENTSGYGQMWRLQEYNAGTLPEPALGDDR
jgi:probable phosphoglycerate mutase